MSAIPADRSQDELLDFIARARDVLREEREVFLRGAYDRITVLNERKQSLLEYLEAAIRTAPRTSAVLGALNSLIADSRRNEQIITAAREGLALARRRVAALREARRGAIAYAEDGTRIACRADRIDSDKSA